jgi:hypothetical protein
VRGDAVHTTVGFASRAALPVDFRGARRRGRVKPSNFSNACGRFRGARATRAWGRIPVLPESSLRRRQTPERKVPGSASSVSGSWRPSPDPARSRSSGGRSRSAIPGVVAADPVAFLRDSIRRRRSEDAFRFLREPAAGRPRNRAGARAPLHDGVGRRRAGPIDDGGATLLRRPRFSLRLERAHLRKPRKPRSLRRRGLVSVHVRFLPFPREQGRAAAGRGECLLARVSRTGRNRA